MGCSKEEVFADRMQEILASMAEQWPSLSVMVDLWRPCVVSQSEDQFSDDATEVFVRLAEQIPAFFVETSERWFDKELGIIRQNTNHVIIPSGLGIRVDDHVMLNGVPWLITQAAEQAGVAKLTMDKLKSRFVAPARFATVYRQFQAKACIV